jgi:L-alanine-DL-glutamate epimerase-like enolase superfamily enzyme
MKIIKFEFYPVTMKLKEPYTIAYETVDKTSNMFCRLITNENVIGMGAAAPDPGVTGESIETVTEDCKTVIEPFLKGKDPLRIAKIITELKPHLQNHPSTLAMIDMALYDILGKKSGLPVYTLLGGFRTRIATSITVGILPMNELLKKCKAFIDDGFRVIKIKGGLNVDEDIEKIIKIREVVGKNIALRFDANQGYTVDQSNRFVEQTRKAKLELIEQPTPRNELELLGKVTKSVPIPVMADESLMNLLDVFKLAKNELVDTINIKLMKVGGIHEALHINSVAKAANLEAMIGCMDEAALGIAAGLHFALARPNVDYADLDGHLDLIDDPTYGAVILKKGYLYTTEKPGLGFSSKEF